MKNRNVVVVKFGGTSVADKKSWLNILGITENHISKGRKPLLVCSALSQVSNKLETAIALCTKDKHRDVLEDIRNQHQSLANDLEIDWQLVAPLFKQLEQLCLGASLIQEMQPSLQAKIMSFGELLSTKLGSLFLSNRGVLTHWLDARSHLKTLSTALKVGDQQHYLASPCHCDYDVELEKVFHEDSSSAMITQGFIAGDLKGQTVLLGRGGSDVSASYFAAKLKAERLEIWTSVPGMFTANPHQVESSRLLMHLDYEEAQELASSGAKVLHPRCIEPVARVGIPLYIKWTDRPSEKGTVIDNKQQATHPKIKAVSTKKGVHIISMDNVSMWQTSGFLADIFLCFKNHNLSVDQIATSETNVTVTLENISQVVEEESLENLCEDLRKHCHPTLIGPCATISIVGKKIRSQLHRLSAAFSALEEKQVFLLTQAASDLNFSITVPENEESALLHWLHGIFFNDVEDDKFFGSSWMELSKSESLIKEADRHQEVDGNKWWRDKRKRLLDTPTPAFVYNLKEIEKNADRLLSIAPISKVHFAMKANSNPAILRLLYKKGVSFDCVSFAEIDFLDANIENFDYSRIVFTPNFAPIDEYLKALDKNILVTIDNIELLRRQPEIFKNKKIILRVDSDISKGHHTHVRTSGVGSKFGIRQEDLEEANQIAQTNAIDVIGLHSHVGSGVKSPETWAKNAMVLAGVAKQFPNAKILDIGGGLGVPTKASDAPFDIEGLKKTLAVFKEANPDIDIWIEPGRYFVAQAGVLLAKVTQTKGKSSRKYVGLETGMNSLIRQPLYGAHHEIFNLSKLDHPNEIVADVVGPICESGDVLGYQCKLPTTEWGDYILIANAGAYGYVMGSNYNLRPPAEEVILD